MKRTVFVFLMVVLSIASVYGQAGFTGPGSQANMEQVQTVTVSQAKNMPNKSLVILTGTIIQSARKDYYVFRDSTGDIAVEIDKELWHLLDLSVGINDRVEIRGKLKTEKRETKIDVKYIRKI